MQRADNLTEFTLTNIKVTSSHTLSMINNSSFNCIALNNKTTKRIGK